MLQTMLIFSTVLGNAKYNCISYAVG